MDALASISFPVLRGLQAGREYFVGMWTLRMLSRVTVFDEAEVPPEIRSQRVLNHGRLPEMVDYLVNDPKSYVFSALTASIDAEWRFEPLDGTDQLGTLHVPLDANYVINDGQHRRAAILQALKERPELASETIAMVFYLDIGLARCQQMFSDLNRHAVRPSRSLGVLYDHRDAKAKLAREVVLKSSFFREIVDLERSSLAARSKKLFTLSAFYTACADLVRGLESGDLEQDASRLREYWEKVASHMPEWRAVREGRLSSGEVRQNMIHSHGLVLQALARVGSTLLRQKNWKNQLRRLRQIDWSRRNTDLWEHRALHNGAVLKSSQSLHLTTAVIKRALGIPLTDEEQLAETQLEAV